MIRGIQKTSLIDYPGKICTILFTGGCNMRCPFCHNPDLVRNKNDLPLFDEGAVLGFLEKRKQWIDGITITGGEPLIQRNLPPFMRKVKSLGLLVKLDTNGLQPELLQEVIQEKLVDYIAMDIKSDKDHYKDAAGCAVNMKKIEQSISIIKNSGISYEFRSTVVPDFFNDAVMHRIGCWLKGSKQYYLQQFRSSVPLLDKSFQGKPSCTPDQLEHFKEIMEKYVDHVAIRN